jgi:hypothetical protein
MCPALAVVRRTALAQLPARNALREQEMAWMYGMRDECEAGPAERSGWRPARINAGRGR